jgi:hypothetical protein
MKSVIYTLIHDRFDPTISIANLTDLCYFQRSVIANAESPEIPFLMKIIHFTERGLVRRAPIRSMQVPHIDLISFQTLQGFLQCETQMFRPMSGFDIWAETKIRARGKFGVHDESAVLPVQLAEILLGATAAIDDGGVDFGVAVFLEDIEDRSTFFKAVNSGLFGTCLAVSTGREVRVKGGDIPCLPSVMAPNTMSTEVFGVRAILKISFEKSSSIAQNAIGN